MNVAIDWPNMWLSGSRFRKRIGRERPRVPAVLQNLALDRHDVGQQVAMRDHDALRLGRRARREDDLGDVVAGHGGIGHLARVVPVELRERPDVEAGVLSARLELHLVAGEEHAALHDAAHAPEEVDRRAVVDRHRHDALQQAAPQRRDPFRPVLGPEQDRVALGEAGARGAGRRRRGRRARPRRTCGRGCGSRCRGRGTRRG